MAKLPYCNFKKIIIKKIKIRGMMEDGGGMSIIIIQTQPRIKTAFDSFSEYTAVSRDWKSILSCLSR